MRSIVSRVPPPHQTALCRNSDSSTRTRSSAARARKCRKGRLSALRAHTTPPLREYLLGRTLKPLKRSERARTEVAEGRDAADGEARRGKHELGLGLLQHPLADADRAG
jgi:hypothetical protein